MLLSLNRCAGKIITIGNNEFMNKLTTSKRESENNF